MSGQKSQEFDSVILPQQNEINDGISQLTQLRLKIDANLNQLKAKLEADTEITPSIESLLKKFEEGNYNVVINESLALIEREIDDPRIFNILGASVAAQGDFTVAIKAFNNALLLEPNNIVAHNNLGNIHKKLQDFENAKKHFDLALEIDENNPVIVYNSGNLDKELGNFIVAQEKFEKAISIDPCFGKAWLNLGTTLFKIGDYESSAEAIKQALKHDKGSECQVKAQYNLAMLLRMKGEVELARSRLQSAIQIDPNYAQAYVALGHVETVLGDRKVLDRYEQALSIKPELLESFCARCFTAHYFSDISSDELYEYHKSFGRQFAQPPVELKPAQLQRHEEKLRIGYVSPDFQQHSVAYFFESLLKAHNKDQVEVFCYYNHAKVDQTTERLMEYADHWRSIVGQSDEQVINLIQEDGINILVDLAGHTNENRLTLFAHKPAPVQVTWLGYPNTTGLDAIDYRFTDDIADPVGEADQYHTETLVRLPTGMWCYNGDHAIPASKQLPYEKNGFITFGSFNNLAKVTPQVLETWADILNQVPNSRLLIKTKELADELTQQKLLQTLSDKGIDEQRISLKAALPNKEDHLNLYAEIDIALDSFPFNGATTTCEALWMGVPVLTLRGNRHVARVSASMMHRVGLDNFIAESREDYINKASQLALNTDYLTQLRQTMRERVASSTLCDANRFAKTIERAYNSMWEDLRTAKPNSSELVFAEQLKQSVEQFQNNNFKEVVSILEPLASREDRDSEILNLLGCSLLKLGLHDRAIRILTEAGELNKSSAEPLCNLGTAYFGIGQEKKSLDILEEAIGREPNHVPTLNNLGHVYEIFGHTAKAIEHLNRVISIDPNFADARNNLGNSLRKMGDYESALVQFNKSLSQNPSHIASHSSRCFTTCYFDSDKGESYEYHKSFGRQFAQPPVELKPAQLQRHEEKLRIGYVSPDFQQHSVAYFFESLLKAHNKDQVEVFCYYNHAKVDQTTERLMEYADHWRSIVGQSDEQVINLIQEDGINILVDLAGHTNENRLTLFAHKPAPVQVTWLGYPNTTGLDAIDYRFTDDIADPVGEADQYHTETLVRLPTGMWCYNGDHAIPASKQLPYEKNGFITFGSFNNLAKVTPQVLETWADILNQVPNSRLLIKTKELADELTQQKLLQTLSDKGIDEQRISLKAALPNKEDHLNLYAEIDIALDSFPFNGATTTCEALWMGVPVLTLRGNRHVARVSASMMHRVGLDNFIAESREDYINKASQLALNTDYLTQLRQTMRERVASSTLCDANRFAKTIERAYNSMWEEKISSRIKK